MKQKEVIFTYLRGTVKLKCLKALLSISVATYISFIFIHFHIELCLWCLPPTLLYSLSGHYPFSTIVIFSVAEGNTLWRVICHCVGHREALLLESLLQHFVMLQFFDVSFFQALQNCSFVMCFCFVTITSLFLVKFSYKGSKTLCPFIDSACAFFFYLTFPRWCKKHH